MSLLDRTSVERCHSAPGRGDLDLLLAARDLAAARPELIDAYAIRVAAGVAP